MINAYKLYPQYSTTQDRRQHDLPVSAERRSGMDRRAQGRISIDRTLSKDIVEIKSKVHNNTNSNKNASLINKFIKNIAFNGKTAEKINPANFNTPIQKTTNLTNIIKNNEQGVNAAGSAAIGLLAGIMGTLLLGPVAGVASFGVGIYFGTKAVSSMVKTHLKNK